MITNLKIQNFTLIDSLDIDLQRGFSVITGETGAGKSIILGALTILLGHRADTKAIKAGSQRCCVEAHFDIDGYGLQDFFDDNNLDYDATDCILRREITAAGKSRAFINDTPVPLTIMRQLGEKLVDIHSQHQNLLLNDADFQLSVIDIIAKDQKELADYQTAYKEYRHAVKHLDELRKQTTSNREQEDYMRFQLGELEDAGLDDAGEQEELEAIAESMNHTEEIKDALYTVDNALNADDNGILQQLKRASNSLDAITSIFPASQDSAERISSVLIELKDLSGDLSSLLDQVDFDPREQQRINDRLDLFYSLERKHHCDSVDRLIEIRDELRGKLDLIDNSDEALQQQEAEVKRCKEKAVRLADVLTKIRKKAAKIVEKDMLERLIPLGMPKVQFTADIKQTDLGANGHDQVTFLFSANSSTQLQPVSQVASGGEIARVMLSLKAMISNAVSLPTIIFDEIDTGVSGKIADAMAVTMRDMGNSNRQVISITHLPQIAAMGTYHFRVQKTESAEGTRTRMTRLSDDERINEIAQMLSGSSISEAARQQAKELLNK